MPIKILLVDDSAVVRGMLTNMLSAEPDFEICASASNGQMGVQIAKELQPDIIILDIEMPIMDGITALPLIVAAAPKSKVIIASTLSQRNAEISLKALSLGATDYVAKPSARLQGTGEFFRELSQKIRALTGSSVMTAKPAVMLQNTVPTEVVAATIQTPAVSTTKMLAVVGERQPVAALAIASSTGGPQALLQFFQQIKGRVNALPIFITQHMPPTFTAILSEQIAKESGRPCIEVKGGEIVTPGHVYLAQGDYHLIPERMTSGDVVVRVTQDPPENFCRPAADPMFRALAKIYGKHLLAIVMTGMGQDGMEGARSIVAEGGRVIAQDEKTCVVYGMPRAVAEQNLCHAILPLSEIGAYVIKETEGKRHAV